MEALAENHVAEDSVQNGESTSGEQQESGGVSSHERVNPMPELQKAFETLLQTQNAISAAKTPEQAKSKDYKFWNTQPVPGFEEVIESNKAIEEDKTIEEIRKEPYSLPQGFQWDTL